MRSWNMWEAPIPDFKWRNPIWNLDFGIWIFCFGFTIYNFGFTALEDVALAKASIALKIKI